MDVDGDVDMDRDVDGDGDMHMHMHMDVDMIVVAVFHPHVEVYDEFDQDVYADLSVYMDTASMEEVRHSNTHGDEVDDDSMWLHGSRARKGGSMWASDGHISVVTWNLHRHYDLPNPP